ncbi:hypothetical protein BOTBODRAFT_178419 [Botryobasidium botryosum FD-172 SS1]|uniref:Endonuclease/exonuclease/phosphatase domain-containing protein n=1 Tax=Botryobasidium botryosum (strain FD-172 SS1) TaxID=930990 RepID=A0A067M377_BOTB1|nr:hypothetical protein BOTBODRAFT_178419 [Botryobasidium botryosum FD-172 SS1]
MELIEDRAQWVKIEWKKDNPIEIINTYCPNEPKAKIEFLEKLRKKIKKNKGIKNPLVMGDFNFTEDDIDRFPMRPDDNKVVKTFTKLKKDLNLVDTWRSINPGKINYTFTQTRPEGTSMSRIDRIYHNKKLESLVTKAKITSSAGISDHKITIATINQADQPYTGHGPWKFRTELFEYKPFVDKAKKLLKKAEKDIKKYWETVFNKSNKRIKHIRKENNPQLIWTKTKEDIKELSIKMTKRQSKERLETEKTLRREMETTLRNAAKGNNRQDNLEKYNDAKKALEDWEKNNMLKAQLSAKAHF